MKINFITSTPGPQNRYPVNMYFDPEYGDRGLPAMVGTPGLVSLKTVSANKEIRLLKKHGNLLYCLAGKTLYALNMDLTLNSTIGTVSNNSGPAWIAFAFDQFCVCDGENLYNYSEGSWSLVGAATSVNFLYGYFVYTVAGSNGWYISNRIAANGDAITFDALDKGVKAYQYDNVVTCITDHQECWLFGEDTTEVFYVNNNTIGAFPFSLFDGGVLEHGCGAKASPVKIDNAVFWLTQNAQFVRAEQFAPVIISTAALEREIKGYVRFEDCHGYAYTDEGHTFIVWSFPTANKTLCYDVAANTWHRRSYGVNGARHRSNCYAFFNNKHIVGDYENGKIYELSSSTYTDDGAVLLAQRTGPAVISDTEFIWDVFEIEMEVGVGLASGQGSRALVMFDFSDDPFVSTWSNELTGHMGKTGEYGTKIKWEDLGRSYHRTPRIKISDPVKRVITGAQLYGRRTKF